MNKKPLFPHGFPRKGEIYQINFSPSRGKEIKEIHPGLVVSNDLQNEYGNYAIVVMMTTDDLENVQLFEVFIKNTSETPSWLFKLRR